ncbi:MAG: hypothetical protein ACP5E4_01020 [Candidatus Aenigmatarchaeota archaeon]
MKLRRKKKPALNPYFAVAVTLAMIFLVWFVIGRIEAQGLISLPSKEAAVIGGETDGHGCLVAAGYAWCESLKKCVRPWEEDCESLYAERPEERAANIAMIYARGLDPYIVYNGRDIRVTGTRSLPCPGCWDVGLQFYLDPQDKEAPAKKATLKLTIENWAVTDAVYSQEEAIIITKDECGCFRGRVVDLRNAEGCSENETYMAKVEDPTFPLICCHPND